ncbi:hypothetical protein DFH28DRAFT_336992 [Melampsora americana]|nr:hypothetical protein DFH28DRAFT_336992 [Melampsora americana]
MSQHTQSQNHELSKPSSRPLSLRSTSSDSSSVTQERKIEVAAESKHTTEFAPRATGAWTEDARYLQSTASEEVIDTTWMSGELKKDSSFRSHLSLADSQNFTEDRPDEFTPTASLSPFHSSKPMEDIAKHLNRGVLPDTVEYAEDDTEQQLQDEPDQYATDIHDVTTNAFTLPSAQVNESSPHKTFPTGTSDQEVLIPSAKNLAYQEEISLTSTAESEQFAAHERSGVNDHLAEEGSIEITHPQQPSEQFNTQTSHATKVEPTQEQVSPSQNPTAQSVRHDDWTNDHTTASELKHFEPSSQVTIKEPLFQTVPTAQETEDVSHSIFTEHKLTTTTTKMERSGSQEIRIHGSPQDPTAQQEFATSTKSDEEDYDDSNSEHSEAPCEDQHDEIEIQPAPIHSDLSLPGEATLFTEHSQSTSETPLRSMSNSARPSEVNTEVSDNGTGSPEVSMIFRDLSEEQSALDISVELDSPLATRSKPLSIHDERSSRRICSYTAHSYVRRYNSTNTYTSRYFDLSFSPRDLHHYT